MTLENIANKAVHIAKKEKRHNPRRSVRWLVKGTLSSHIDFKVETINVSSSGLLLEMPTPVNIGLRAYIKIYSMVDGVKKTIDAIVEIMYQVLAQDKFKCGVRFVKIDKLNKLILSSYASNKTKTSVPDIRKTLTVEVPDNGADNHSVFFITDEDNLSGGAFDINQLDNNLESIMPPNIDERLNRL
jgi:hypothetical protein